MNEDIDQAIETAARHTREAAERLRDRPADSPEIVSDAEVVEQRAEDLEELTHDAADDARRRE